MLPSGFGDGVRLDMFARRMLPVSSFMRLRVTLDRTSGVMRLNLETHMRYCATSSMSDWDRGFTRFSIPLSYPKYPRGGDPVLSTSTTRFGTYEKLASRKRRTFSGEGCYPVADGHSQCRGEVYRFATGEDNASPTTFRWEVKMSAARAGLDRGEDVASTVNRIKS
ncbi:hypothetical protein BDW22DRAFT_1345169 [Trametopsis cervina]|nr:hypothetical protein BDW22DRAFT_1345169 [Trametopsis cervina]